MNKQELIKHIEKVKGDKPHYREQYHLGRWQTIESMLELIDQLDEPEITEEQAWEVIERANHQHIAPAYVWIYKKAIQKGLTPTDITGLEENPTISKKETVEVPQMIGAYIKKERGKNTLGNIADEIYNSEESWSNLSEEYRWMRLNFTLFARAWLNFKEDELMKNKEWLKDSLAKEMYNAEIQGMFSSSGMSNLLYDDIVKLIDQLDEPEITDPTISKKETVEVPQFVADYIEKMKNGAYPTIGVSFKTPECMPTNVMNWLGHYDDMDDVDTDAAKKIKKNTARLGLTDTPSNHQKRYK